MFNSRDSTKDHPFLFRFIDNRYNIQRLILGLEFSVGKRPYCESVYQSIRWKTCEVKVGNVGVGGGNPIRIQSMTTSQTRDIEATVEQIIRLAHAGCEIARVTVQGKKEAEACEGIKNTLVRRGYTIPLVADIHFYPPAALLVADFVDKVRINPGNFVDRRATFKTIEYSDASYAAETRKIEDVFTPLVEKCKKRGVALRIGTNHGSLSDRIMNRYGDTPAGMVESAFEFAQVCRDNDFHQIIFSMKSSNPTVMIHAYRLLVARMMEEGWNYPLHLGVTEAGAAEDGRIKSSMGIGSLLLDGLGDTIRVSLTEDPWVEIDPCQRLVKFARDYEGRGIEPLQRETRDFEAIARRKGITNPGFPLHRDGSVYLSISSEDLQRGDFFEALGCELKQGKWVQKADTADAVVVHGLLNDPVSMSKLKTLQEAGVGVVTSYHLPGAVRLMTLNQAAAEVAMKGLTRRFALNDTQCEAAENVALIITDDPPESWGVIEKLQPGLILYAPKIDRIHQARGFFEWLKTHRLDIPVLLSFEYSLDTEDVVIYSAIEMGSLLTDGLGDGVLIRGHYEPNFVRRLSFGILQAARMRSSKTDYISCPGCGRTLFDLQEVTERIRKRTGHLPGVKIAVMGCIVNGPGEMADADFGFVGSKTGMVELYAGKACVEKEIPFAQAEEKLVTLLKQHGRWIEKEEFTHCPG